MKHIVIGDLHGRNVWEEIDISLYDKVVFIGDYVDSSDKTDAIILNNLVKVIELKKNNLDKVVLLWGNHDVQYLYYPRYRCTNFRPSMLFILKSIFTENRGCFQMAYQVNTYLFTHAGVTNAWFNELATLPILEQIKNKGDTVADLLNKLEQTSASGLLFNVGLYRGGHGNGGVLWADMHETSADMLNDYHQVVGHTKVPEIRTISHINKSITYIDVLSKQIDFHEIEIG